MALLRSLLRGSKRRKRALRSEINSGAIRKALSEDEMDEDDLDLDFNENEHDQDLLEDILEQHDLHQHRSMVAQSEYSFPISSTYVPSIDQLHIDRLQVKWCFSNEEVFFC